MAATGRRAGRRAAETVRACTFLQRRNHSRKRARASAVGTLATIVDSAGRSTDDRQDGVRHEARATAQMTDRAWLWRHSEEIVFLVLEVVILVVSVGLIAVLGVVELGPVLGLIHG